MEDKSDRYLAKLTEEKQGKGVKANTSSAIAVARAKVEAARKTSSVYSDLFKK